VQLYSKPSSLACPSMRSDQSGCGRQELSPSRRDKGLNRDHSMWTCTQLFIRFSTLVSTNKSGPTLSLLSSKTLAASTASRPSVIYFCLRERTFIEFHIKAPDHVPRGLPIRVTQRKDLQYLVRRTIISHVDPHYRSWLRDVMSEIPENDVTKFLRSWAWKREHR